MSTDILTFLCPSCGSFVDVHTYSGLCKGKRYNPENAPLKIIAEVNFESRNKRVKCFSCGMHLALAVSIITYVRPLSTQQRLNEEWTASLINH